GIEASGGGFEFTEQSMRREERKGLSRLGGIGKGLVRAVVRSLPVPALPIVACPERRTLRAAKHGTAPRPPAVMRFQPCAGEGQVIRVECEGNGDTLGRDRRQEPHISRLRRHPARQQRVDLCPRLSAFSPLPIPPGKVSPLPGELDGVTHLWE